MREIKFRGMDDKSHIPCLGKCGSTVCQHECFCCLGKNPPEDCKHEDIKLVGAIANTHLCFKCGSTLLANEVYVNYEYVEMGGFCDNEKCDRYLVLVV